MITTIIDLFISSMKRGAKTCGHKIIGETLKAIGEAIIAFHLQSYLVIANLCSEGRESCVLRQIVKSSKKELLQSEG